MSEVVDGSDWLVGWLGSVGWKVLVREVKSAW